MSEIADRLENSASVATPGAASIMREAATENRILSAALDKVNAQLAIAIGAIVEAGTKPDSWFQDHFGYVPGEGEQECCGEYVAGRRCPACPDRLPVHSHKS